jgi:hypothetical protein
VTVTGGCACGAVRYAIDGPLREALVCHCVDCLAAVGAPWTATAARRSDLSLRASGTLRWRVAPASEHGASRGVCDACGTVVFWDAPARETVSFGLSTLDDPPPLTVVAHIWVSHDPGFSADGVVHYAAGYPRDAPDLTWSA